MRTSLLPKNKFLISIVTSLALCTMLLSCNKTPQCTNRVEGRVFTYSEKEGEPFVTKRFLSQGTGKQDVEIILNSIRSTCCPLKNHVNQLDKTTSDSDGYFDFGDRDCEGSYRFVSRHGSNYLHDWYQIEQDPNNRHVLLYNYKSVRINFLTSQNNLETNELRYMVTHQNGNGEPFTKIPSFFRTLSMDTLNVSAMPNCNFKIDIRYKGVDQTHLFYSGDPEMDSIIDITLVE